jgi:hypothetical protein
MRKIKFRAYLIPCGKESYEEVDLGGWAYLEPRDLNDTINELQEEGLILCQYTGLKDKDGKEIYEGDILNLRYKDEKPNVIVLRNLIVDTCWISDELGFGDCTIEIIGNIHENPELLESGK